MGICCWRWLSRRALPPGSFGGLLAQRGAGGLGQVRDGAFAPGRLGGFLDVSASCFSLFFGGHNTSQVCVLQETASRT
jgi:hypothetical protein